MRQLASTHGFPGRGVRQATLLASTLLLSSTEAVSQRPERWQVAAVPVTVIGGAGSEDEELYRVSGAVMLSDGRVAVVNGRPLAVRIFGADGRLQRTVARGGSGPGEIRGSVDLFRLSGDSLLVYSSGSNRWAVFAPGGSLVREQLLDGPLLTFRAIHRGTYFRTDQSGRAGCLPSIIQRVEAATPGTLREGFAEGQRLWLRKPGAPEWTIYDSRATPVGSVVLPDGFTIYQVEGNGILGKRENADGFEEVVVLQMDGSRPTGTGCGDVSVPAAPRELAADISAEMRNAMAAGEGFYATNRRYTRSTEELRVKTPEHIMITIPYAGDRGWSIVGHDRRHGISCVASMGLGGLPGLHEGVILCGR